MGEPKRGSADRASKSKQKNRAGNKDDERRTNDDAKSSPPPKPNRAAQGEGARPEGNTQRKEWTPGHGARHSDQGGDR